MPARSTNVTFTNGSAFTLYLDSHSLSHGKWGTNPPSSIDPFSSGSWSSQSDGFMTGDQGSCSFTIGKNDSLLVTVNWDNPFAGSNSYSQSAPSGYTIGNTGGSGDNASITYTFGASDYSNWMSNLSSIIGSKALNEVMLPGTHDSGTYGINGNCGESPDRPDFVATVSSWLGPKGMAILTPIVGPIAAAAIIELLKNEFSSIIAGWARSQEQSIADQLKGGIRYFDLRVAYNPSDSGVLSKDPNHCYICHGLYSVPLTTVLNDVKTFLQGTTQEVVILDINHIYNFSNINDLTQLLNEVTELIGTWMAPSSMTATSTVSKFVGSHKTAIVLLDSSVTSIDSNFFTNNTTFWSDNDFIVSNWPNTTDIDTLVSKLESELSSHNEWSKYWVLQGILTEGSTQIANGLVPGTKDPSTLLEWAKSTTPVIAGLITSQFTHKKVNIIIADYYNCTPFYVGNIIRVNGQSAILNVNNSFLYHDPKDTQLKLTSATASTHGHGHWYVESLLNTDNVAIRLSSNGKYNERKYLCGNSKTGKIGLCSRLQADGSTNWKINGCNGDSSASNGSVNIICMHGGLKTYLYGKIDSKTGNNSLKLVNDINNTNEEKSDNDFNGTEWKVNHISQPLMLASARSAGVTFMNLLSVTLYYNGGSLSHGKWDPSPPNTIDSGKSGKWSNNSDGFMTGAQGSCSYKIGSTANVVTLNWDTPFVGSNSYSISVSGPQSASYYVIYTNGSGNNANVTYQISSLN